MKAALSIFVGILRLDGNTIRSLTRSPGGPAYAMGLLVAVTLIAGLGRWAALPGALKKPILVERVDRVMESVRRLDRLVLTPVASALDAVARRDFTSGLQSGMPAASPGAASQPETAPALPETDESETTNNTAGTDAGRLSLRDEFRQFVARHIVTPARVEWIVDRIGVAQERVGRLRDTVTALPGHLLGLLNETRSMAERVQPPLGPRFSRGVSVFGYWLRTPFDFAADWLLPALVVLLIARALGGAGSLPRHLTACAIATAPVVLLTLTYLPDTSAFVSIPMSLAIHYFGRALALVGVVWSALILVRALAMVHEVSPWRTLAILFLSWLTLSVLLRLAILWAVAFLLA